MKLKQIVSCFLTKTYKANKKTYREIVNEFHQRADTIQDDWREFTQSEEKVSFKGGEAVSMCFDIAETKLEVQVIFDYDLKEKQLKISVGHWGFAYAPLTKTQYFRLLEKIHEFVIGPDEEEEEV